MNDLYHPMTTDMILERGYFPSPQTMYRRVKKMVDWKLVNIVGCTASGGRPKDVYCTQNYKSDNIEHELKLSEILLKWGLRCVRGKDVCKLRPDATIGNVHIELDTGSMSHTRVRDRLREYESRDDFVVVITKPRRMKQILVCDFLAQRLLVCTFDDALNDGYLTDCHGDKIPLNNLLKKLQQFQQSKIA